MRGTMSAQDEKVCRNLTLVRGDLWGKPVEAGHAKRRRKPRQQKRVAANPALERFADGQFGPVCLRLLDAEGKVPTERIANTRRHYSEARKPWIPLVRLAWDALASAVDEQEVDALSTCYHDVIEEGKRMAKAKRQAEQSNGTPPRAA